RRPEANPSWKMLAAQARDALAGRSNDHASVTRLMSALGPEYSAVMTASPAPSPADAELAAEAGGAESMVLSQAERAYLRPSVPPVATEPVPTPSCSGDEPASRARPRVARRARVMMALARDGSVPARFVLVLLAVILAVVGNPRRTPSPRHE